MLTRGGRDRHQPASLLVRYKVPRLFLAASQRLKLPATSEDIGSSDSGLPQRIRTSMTMSASVPPDCRALFRRQALVGAPDVDGSSSQGGRFQRSLRSSTAS